MTRRVRFDPDATRDLAELFDYLPPLAGERTARAYLGELHACCMGFSTFPQRGMLREGIRPGLRLVGYRRRATIAFTVLDDGVLILRIFTGRRQIAL